MEKKTLYPSYKINRGVCLIFSNKTFHEYLNKKERRGAYKDEEHLQESFEKLNFEVRICRNYTMLEILNTLKKVSEEDHTHNDCLVCCFSTHGKDNFLYAKDGSFNLENIYTYFTNDRCPTLKSKPKVFIVQACIGEKKDKGVEYKNEEKVAECDTDSISSNYQIDSNCLPAINYILPQGEINAEISQKEFDDFISLDENNLENVNEEMDPFQEMELEFFGDEVDVEKYPKATYIQHLDFDVLTVMSTIPDYVSWRHQINGSYLITHLCEVLNEFGNNMDLLKMLAIMNYRMSRITMEQHEHHKTPAMWLVKEYKQMPYYSSSLTKDLYFSLKTSS